MNILNKPITTFTFNDVISFCQEGHREGWQIDYKRDLPQGGLSKFFAALSNTRGGVILIGVEEDRNTGIPTSWNGVDNNAQSIERIHQWASNVEPTPSYEVYPTDERNGKIFILVRIFEGDRTPYYVQNDPRVYVRTGNVTPSVDLASPEMLELLVGKKQKAQRARDLYLKMSDDVYTAGLKRAERERLKTIVQEKEEYCRKKEQWIADGDPVGPYASNYYQKELGSEASICNILLQPFYPKTPLISPKELKGKIMEIRDGSGTFRLDFPSLNPEPIPEGVMRFEWGEHDGEILNEQFYSTGLVRLSLDLLRVGNGKKDIYMARIASALFEVLKAAGNFYRIIGYQGGIKGYLSLNNAEGVRLRYQIFQSLFPYDDKEGLLPSYNLDLDIDTSILNNDKEFQNYFIKTVQEIYWMFGYEEIREDAIKAFLKDRRWLIT